MEIKFTRDYPKKPTTLILGVYDKEDERKFSPELLDSGEKVLDDQYLQGSATYQIQANKNFNAQRGQIHKYIPPQNSKWDEIILVGLGKRDELRKGDISDITKPLYGSLDNEGDYSLYTNVESLSARLADGLVQESYSFDKYKGSKSTTPQSVSFLVGHPRHAKRLYEPLKNVTEANFWAADLANEPANKLNPKTYAECIQEKFDGTNVTVKVIEADELEKMGAGAIVAVGQGSKTPSCMVIMEYDGTDGAVDRPVGLVGKGVTFDTGGYSIKPSAGMPLMKFDMGGSAAVVGAMKALAANNVKEKVVAIVGLAENMLSKEAYLPGDVITALNGTTIEVDNTDAEGRLVMADCLTHLQREYNPHTLLDAATLTGACVAALGHEYAGIMSHEKSLKKQLKKAGKQTSEKVWTLPLNKIFAAAMKGRTTDLSNMSSIPYAGASTAAEFLYNFIEKNEDGSAKCKWAHIDMAGPGIPASKISDGYGVRLLTQFIENGVKKRAKKSKPSGGKPGPDSGCWTPPQQP